jgi:probable HAF family extracellular repeat protein
VRQAPGIRGSLLLVVVASLMAAATLGGQRTFPIDDYTLTDLGTLGGPESSAAGVNVYGEVTGTSTTATGARHAFRYRNGQMLDLGTLTGGLSSEATAISDGGVVVGSSGWNGVGPGFPQMTLGFAWQDGTMRSTDYFYCICSFNRRSGESRAYAVNPRGIVVGHSLTPRAGQWQVFWWQAGVGIRSLIDVNTPDGAVSSVGYGINAHDDIAGEQGGRALVIRGGVREVLGVLNGDVSSSARAVNAIGQVAGFSVAADGVRRAFIWDLTLRALPHVAGYVSSEALAINVDGDLVGRSGNRDLSDARAALWRAGVAIDLNSRIAAPDWLLVNATGINDVGQIVGTALRGGQKRAYLLTPDYRARGI